MDRFIFVRDIKRILQIFHIISIPVFIFLLYRICGITAWQSNLFWIVLLIASTLIIARSQRFQEYFSTHLLVCVIYDLLLSFCLIGNRLFCYPLSKNVGLAGIAQFLLFSFSCNPITVLLLCLPTTDRFQKLFRRVQKKEGSLLLHFLLYAVCPLVIGVVSMIAFNPCIVSYDAFEAIAEAKQLVPVQEYSGVLYVLWFRLLLSLFDSAAFLCIVQVLLYSILGACFFSYIERKFHLRFPVLYGIWVVFSLLPGNIMMLITLSKDVYYGISLFLLFFSMMKLCYEPNKLKSNLLFGTAVFLTWSVRQSGSLVIAVVMVIGIFFCRSKKSFALSTILAVAISLGFQYGAARAVNAEPIFGGMKYIALYQDILGVSYSGGDLSDDTVTLVEKGVGDDPEFKNLYTPYWAYYDYYYPELADERVPHFIKCYLDTFFRNPVLLTRAVLCRMDMAWDIRPGINASETWQWQVQNKGGNWTDLVEARRENSLTGIINAVGEFSKNYPFKDLVWRAAIWNVVFLFLLRHNRQRRSLFVFLPVFGYFLAYLVSLGWSHYRYYWADQILALAGSLSLIAAIIRNPCELTKNDGKI